MASPAASASLRRSLPRTLLATTPGAAGRLQRCCRVFRVIFSGEWLWEKLCRDHLTEEDLFAKPIPMTWRAYYASWAPSPLAWFRAYAKITKLLAEGAISMSVCFHGEGVPASWAKAECLQVKEIRATEFGVTGHAGFDDSGELPEWDRASWRARGASVAVKLEGGVTADCKLLEVDCSACSRERVPHFFEWVEHVGIRRAGLYLSNTCLGDDDDDHWVEMLDIVVMIPTARFLESILGLERMQKWAVDLLGIGAGRPDSGLMVFAELRQQARFTREEQVFESSEVQPVVAKIRAPMSLPSWRDLRRDFFFRRGYKHVLCETSDDPQPLPSFDFTFDFEEVRECTSDRFLLSFWCLDSSGRTSFASHFVPFSTNPIINSGRKAQCLLHAPAVITPDFDWTFFLAKLTVRSGPHQLPMDAGPSPGVQQLHLIMPPFRLPERLDRSECLRAALLDFCQREVQQEEERRGDGDGDDDDEDGPDFDSESDLEEEKSWWEDRAAVEQESLARKLWTARFVHRKPVKPTASGSPWRGLAPLRRCRKCRCILTRLMPNGGLFRERCFRCQRGRSWYPLH